MKTNFGSYLDYLGKERFRAVIIYNDKISTLSQFACKAAETFNGKYIDLLEHFKTHSELAKAIDIFSLQDLLDFLQNESRDQSFFIINKIDILLDTWQKTERVAFFRMIKNQWDSYKNSMKSIIIFSMHSSGEILDLKIKDSQGNTRIHPLSNFKAID